MKRNRNILPLLIILTNGIFVNSFYAQDTRSIDSLTKLIHADKTNKNKVNHLNKLSWEFKYTNPDTAIVIGRSALAEAENIDWKIGRATALGNIGVYYYLQGKYDEALVFYERAMTIDKELISKNDISGKLGLA